MRLKIKTVSGEMFEVNAESIDKIEDIKKKIENTNPNIYPYDKQKLICAGKILKNESTLEECKITERSFIVVVAAGTLKSTPIKNTPSSSSSKKDNTPVKKSVAAKSSNEQISTTTVAAPASIPGVPRLPQPSANSISSLPNPVISQLLPESEEVAKSIEQIKSMGFDEERALRAFTASFGNVNRAVEYLLNGFPCEESTDVLLNQSQNSTESNLPSSQILSADMQSSDESLSASTNPNPTRSSEKNKIFEALRSMPKTNQIRSLIRSNPQVLESFIQNLSSVNPELLQLINENKEDFLAMLNEDSDESSTCALADRNEGDDDGDGNCESSPSLDDTPTSQATVVSQVNSETPLSLVITCTPEEKEAINRLKALGFSESAVIEAYFACEKNEELAANFLFSNLDD